MTLWFLAYEQSKLTSFQKCYTAFWKYWSCSNNLTAPGMNHLICIDCVWHWPHFMVDQSGENTSLLAFLPWSDIVDHMYVPEAILYRVITEGSSKYSPYLFWPCIMCDRWPVVGGTCLQRHFKSFLTTAAKNTMEYLDIYLKDVILAISWGAQK